ncbi:Hypothetical protein A7982_11124 [Minicystis rosea]|nr:Hypothetical protein A7982_11124 [Minicystis rosea]
MTVRPQRVNWNVSSLSLLVNWSASVASPHAIWSDFARSCHL